MKNDPARPQPSPVHRFLGAAMMAVGFLILLLSGLCTGVGLFAALMTAEAPKQDITEALRSGMIVLLWGMLPMGVGIALILVGRALRRGL